MERFWWWILRRAARRLDALVLTHDEMIELTEAVANLRHTLTVSGDLPNRNHLTSRLWKIYADCVDLMARVGVRWVR